MSGGAFQVSREIFENEIWSDVVKFRIFFYILGKAIFSQEGVYKAGIHVKRGQYLRSMRNLQSDLAYREGRGNAIKKYPLTTIQRKIKSLVNEERITTKSTEYGTLFTVVNYNEYQGFGRYEKQSVEQRRNSDGTAMEQQRNNNKNVNKDKNVKEQIPYAEIINHLNEKAGKNFKSATSKTRELIQARWNEGNRLKDFIKVIDVCCEKWSGKTFSNGQAGDTYLQPSTLFNGKFDERLNWSIKSNVVNFGPKKTPEQIAHEKMVDEMGY